MSRLDVSTVTIHEAADRLIEELSALNFTTSDKDIVCYDPEGHQLRYKLSEVVQHVRDFIEGKDDFIGEREVEFMRLQISYERGSRR